MAFIRDSRLPGYTSMAGGVVKLAPDALVFINGQETFATCNQCSKRSKTGHDVTSITVDLPIEGVSSATISMSAPLHDRDRWWSQGRSIIRPMHEVEIFMRGRFNVGPGSDELAKEPTYYPVFWGIVTRVDRDYNGGKNTLSVNCKGMLHWWELNHVNACPAYITEANGPHKGGVLGTIFDSMDPFAITAALASLSTGNLLGIQGLGSYNLRDERFQYDRALEADAIKYWDQRFGAVGRALRIIGPEGEIIDTSAVDPRKTLSIVRDEAGHEATAIDNKATAENSRKPIQPFDFRSIMPYAKLGLPNMFASNLTSKKAIMDHMKNMMHYEFYQDSTGEIFFKPPFYNMKTASYPPYVIEDKDIRSLSLDEDESAVVTRLDVQGSFDQIFFGDNDSSIAPRAFHVDPQLLREYGLRQRTISMPAINDANRAYLYAIGELDRLNSLRFGGTATINGRPELRLGHPVFIKSENAYYYVTGIGHSFTYGQSYTTNLRLTAGRKLVVDEYNNAKKFHIFKGSLASDAVKVNEKISASSDVVKKNVTGKKTPETTAGKTPGAIMTTSAAAKDKAAENAKNATKVGDTTVPATPVKQQATFVAFIGDFDETSVADSSVTCLEFNSKGMEIKFPYTDGEGREVIGGFPYARNLKVSEKGEVFLGDEPVASLNLFTSVEGHSPDDILKRSNSAALERRLQLEEVRASITNMTPSSGGTDGPAVEPPQSFASGSSGLGSGYAASNPLDAQNMTPDRLQETRYCDCGGGRSRGDSSAQPAPLSPRTLAGENNG